jgi:hypothetical protein
MGQLIVFEGSRVGKHSDASQWHAGMAVHAEKSRDMNHGDYWLYLVRQAFIYDDLWYITLPLFVLAVLAVIKNYSVDKAPFKRRHLLALIPFAFPPLLLAYGTMFEHTLTRTQAVPAWQTMILWGIVISQALINVLCFVHFKRMRLSVLALTALQGWLTLFPFLVAVMSVSGTWL